MKKTLLILLASSLLFAFGCDKKGASVLSALELNQEAPSEHWDKSVINGFLPYIPADSAMVYVSTRAIDLDSPHINDYLTKTAQVLSDKKAKVALVDDAAGLGSLQLYDAFIELTSNYENAAPQWGLNPKGRMDFAIYMVDAKIVAKLSLTDSDTATIKVAQMLKDFNDMRVTLAIAGNEKWMIISGEDERTPVLALQFGTQTLTAALLFDAKEDMKDLNTLLKPAANPISKKALGKLSAQTTALAFIDNVKLLKQALNSKSGLAKFLKINDKDLSSESCVEEMMDIAKSFPRIDFDVSMDGNSVSMNTVFKMTNRETLDDLESILGQRIDIQAPDNVGEVFLPIDVGQTFKVLDKWGSNIKQEPYNSRSLRPINTLFWLVSGISKAKFKKNLEFINRVTGFGLSLYLNVGVGEQRQTRFFSYLLMSKSFDTIVLNKAPEPITDLTFVKDNASRYDLSHLAKMKLIVDASLKDRGLFITNSPDLQDFRRTSERKAIKSKDFLSLKFDDGVLSFISELLNKHQRYNDKPGYNDHPIDLTLKMDYLVSLKLSLVDDGLKVSGNATF